MSRIAVLGAGGFIGSNLVRRLKAGGHAVRGIDVKRPEFEESAADEFIIHDLTTPPPLAHFLGCDEVYALAANMGGIGFITANLAEVASDNVLINVNTLRAASDAKVGRLLYASSACVYPHGLQSTTDLSAGLREEDAWPADPEPGYGLEKLFSEELCRYFRADRGLATSVVRFHNVYGSPGTYRGGREKSPAAICRKVAASRNGGEVEVWGDGEQTRSYMHVDDCVEGLIRLMASGYAEPLNLGREEMVSVNELVDVVCDVAGKKLSKRHDLTKPQGVRGRNSENSRLRKVLGWEPGIDLRTGIAMTYPWIAEQVAKGLA